MFIRSLGCTRLVALSRKIADGFDFQFPVKYYEATSCKGRKDLEFANCTEKALCGTIEEARRRRDETIPANRIGSAFVAAATLAHGVRCYLPD